MEEIIRFYRKCRRGPFVSILIFIHVVQHCWQRLMFSLAWPKALGNTCYDLRSVAGLEQKMFCGTKSVQFINTLRHINHDILITYDEIYYTDAKILVSWFRTHLILSLISHERIQMTRTEIQASIMWSNFSKSLNRSTSFWNTRFINISYLFPNLFE